MAESRAERAKSPAPGFSLAGEAFSVAEATQPDAARQAMTEEEIDALKAGPSQSYRDFARAVERHHEIKEA